MSQTSEKEQYVFTFGEYREPILKRAQDKF